MNSTDKDETLTRNKKVVQQRDVMWNIKIYPKFDLNSLEAIHC